MLTLSWLRSARVQRLDLPQPGLLALTLYLTGERRTLLARFDGQGLAGVARERPRGEGASGLAQKLRKRLGGSRLAGAEWLGGTGLRPAALRLDFEGRASDSLCLLFDRQHAQLVCLDATGRAVIASDTVRLSTYGGRLGKPLSLPPPTTGAPFPDTEQDWEYAARALTAEQACSTDRRARRELDRHLRRRIRKVERRLTAIALDLARIEQAPALREEAQWLLCHLDQIPPGTAEAVLPPREAGAAPVRITLDPSRSAVANAEARFAKARRYERGASIGHERHAEAQRELESLQAQRARLDDPDTDLEALARADAQPTPRAAPARSRAGRIRTPARQPFRRFRSEGEWTVLVGRSARDNDALTLHHARPGDLWLHVRDSPGSHVVVPCPRNAACPDRVRLDAALLAAHFSPARQQDGVDIIHTERRYVRKRRGSPPGSVQLQRERVLRLRHDEARLRWLLARE